MQGGIAGRLRRVTDEDSYSKALEDASTLPVSGGGLALLIAPSAISTRLLGQVQANDAVIGVIFEDHSDTNPPPGAWSPADGFPNKRFGLHPASTHVWNPNGNGLMNANLRKPWYSLGATDSAAIKGQLEEAAKRGGGVQVGAEFTLQMMATTDATTCLRRNWCQPLGGYSTGGALGVASLAALKQAPEVVAVVASLDSASLFHTRSPGAVSDMSGSVALIAAFDALSSLNAAHRATRPAVFHWFTGEAWGYMGSKAFVKAMGQGNMPFNATSIFALLEAKQVGTRQVQGLFVHSERDSPNVARKALLDAAAAAGVGVTPAKAGGWGIPPSSTMSFLLANSSVTHAVLTDHDEVYANQFYHSIFDDLANVDSDLVCKAANVLARAVASLQGFNDTTIAAVADFSVNCSLVDDLISCLAKSWNCSMMKDYLGEQLQVEYPSNYVGVWNRGGFSIPVKFVHDIIAERSAFANPTVEKPEPLCERVQYPCGNDTGRCIRNKCVDLGLVWYVPGWSSGIEWSNGPVPSWGWHVVDTSVNNTLPVFVESNWNSLSLRTFVQEDPAVQFVSVLFGVSFTIIASLLCLIATRKFNAVWRVE